MAILMILFTARIYGQQAPPPEVSVEDVRQFVDPTQMVSGSDYTFSFTSAEMDSRLYSHTIAPYWAFSKTQGVWAEIPIKRLSTPNSESRTGVGDVRLGWGAILREDLQRRLTTAIISFEVQPPSGDADRGLGTGRWIVAPGMGLVLNPTDYFPVILLGTYMHSFGGSGQRAVRSLQLDVSTIHILPKGFWVSALPGFTLGSEERVFTLGVGAGRALTRRFAADMAYVQRVSGDRALNRTFSVSLRFILPSTEKGRGQ